MRCWCWPATSTSPGSAAAGREVFRRDPRGPKSDAAARSTCRRSPQPKTVTMKDRVAATLILRTWAVPGMNDPDVVALDVFGAVLGGLASSRLDNALVREEKIAVQVSASVQSMAQIGMFAVQAIVKPGVDPAIWSRSGSTRSSPICSRTGPTADEVQRVATTECHRPHRGPGIGRRLRRQGRGAGLGRALFGRSRPSTRSSSTRWRRVTPGAGAGGRPASGSAARR